MFRTSRLIAPALLCALTALGPGTVLAQAAGNLDCNKCVDSSDVAKNAITKKKIEKGAVSKKKIREGAVDLARLSSDLQDHVGEREPFYITLDGDGATATIATNGPLTMFARCVLDDPINFEDRIEIVTTSSADGWLEEDENDFDFGNNPPLAAGVEVISYELQVTPSAARYDNLNEVSAIAPDGSYLALDGESGGLGLNLFGHDCLVMGNIYRITGTL